MSNVVCLSGISPPLLYPQQPLEGFCQVPRVSDMFTAAPGQGLEGDTTCCEMVP